jgi:hypothetical protein
MAQFDVYRSPEVVVPLMAFRAQSCDDRLGLTPDFQVNGRQEFLNRLEVQTVRRSLLGKAIASLADDAASSRIVNTIDSMITRVYG